MVYGSALFRTSKLESGDPMRCTAFVLAASLLTVAGSAQAADDAPTPALAQPLPAAPAAPAEETPGFQAVRPVAEPAPAAQPVPAAIPAAPPVVAAPVAPLAPAPVVAAAVAPSPAPVVETGGLGFGLLSGLMGAGLLALGGAIAGWSGTLVARSLHTGAEERRRAAIKCMLVVELESRRQAFEAVPVPPNAEAGVSFVSAVCALADMEAAWNAAQGSLHLLGEKQAGHLTVHYGAVRYVANFVKGLSFTAGLRMLQANRIGGHPCPDPAAMREAHVELAAAFCGLDKIIQGLKG